MRFLGGGFQKFKLQLPSSAAARHVTSGSQGRGSEATSGSGACKKTHVLCLEIGPACGGCRGCAHLGRNWRTKQAFAKSRCGARVAPAHGVAPLRSNPGRLVRFAMPAVPWMHVGRAVGGGATGIYNHVRPRTASAGAPSKHDSGQRARRYVRCFPGFESPCSSAREHPGKSSARFDIPVAARVFMHHARMSTHATSPSACPCVACALISAHIHIQRQPTLRVHAA